MAIRSISPVTEYTSLTPSMEAIVSATSGMRATSALTNTMAVIMAPPGCAASRQPTWASRSSGRAGQRAGEPGRVERDEGLARRGDRVQQLALRLGTAERAGPHPIDVHQPDAGSLEPA